MLSDEEFLAAFEQGRLPKEQWTHDAHVRMAWLYLRREVSKAVLPKVRQGIQRLNAALGNSVGYHETVTQAYLLLIASRLASGGSARFDEFQRRHPKLFQREDPILLWHYRKETIDSAEARARFVAPDLEPLPSSAYSRAIAALMHKNLDWYGEEEPRDARACLAR